MTDEIEGNDDVVILSHSLWMRRFNGDPDVVGRAVRFSGRMFRVVGVLPEGFQHVGGHLPDLRSRRARGRVVGPHRAAR